MGKEPILKYLQQQTSPWKSKCLVFCSVCRLSCPLNNSIDGAMSICCLIAMGNTARLLLLMGRFSLFFTRPSVNESQNPEMSTVLVTSSCELLEVYSRNFR